MPQLGHICACGSTKPGTIVLPLMSISLAPGGAVTEPVFPTAAIRLFTTNMSPFSITSSPFIVIIRAFFINTIPTGKSFLKKTVTSFSVALNFSSSFFASFIAVVSFAFNESSNFFTESATFFKIETAFSLAVESAVFLSCIFLAATTLSSKSCALSIS